MAKQSHFDKLDLLVYPLHKPELNVKAYYPVSYFPHLTHRQLKLKFKHFLRKSKIKC